MAGSVTAGIRARLYTRDFNTPLIACFWNKICKIVVCLQKCVRNAKDYLVREALEGFWVLSGDFVNDDGFPWPGSLPPGWEVEWEDDSA